MIPPGYSRCAGLFMMACIIVAAAAKTHAAESYSSIGSLPEMLDQFDLDDTFFAQFMDGQPLNSTELESVSRLLYRLQRIPQIDLDRWSLSSEGAANRLDDVADNRGELAQLRGRVTFIKPLPLEASLAARLEQDNYLLCRFVTDDNRELTVIVPNVPKSWKIGESINHQSSCHAVLLKGTIDDGQKIPLVVSPHLVWYPPTLLGGLGMDVSLFDDLANRKPIRTQERECFYQLLAAAGRAEPGQLEEAAAQTLKEQRESLPDRIEREANPQTKAMLQHALEQAKQNQSDVVPLFNNPDAQHGQLKLLTGIARRALRIRVDEPDLHARFGIRHYYEVEMFTDDSQNNPITICATELPQEMPLGDDLYEHVRVAAFFFKTWSYPVGRVEQKGDQLAKSQLAPLLIARSLQRLSHGKAATGLADMIPVILLALLSLGIVFAALRMRRSTRLSRSANALADDAAVRSALAKLEAWQPPSDVS